MRIIGVDPGTIVTGFGIVEYDDNRLIRIKSGVIVPDKKLEMVSRLGIIYDELDKIIKTYLPDQFSIETAFYGKNIQSALKIGYARGVSMLVAVHNNLTFAEYSPREVKKAIVGKGGATKEQVQFMIRKLMYIKEEKMKFDESDGLAIAACHAFKANSFVTKSGNWKKFVSDNPDRVRL